MSYFHSHPLSLHTLPINQSFHYSYNILPKVSYVYKNTNEYSI